MCGESGSEPQTDATHIVASTVAVLLVLETLLLRGLSVYLHSCCFSSRAFTLDAILAADHSLKFCLGLL
jgi:hypothetical protein